MRKLTALERKILGVVALCAALFQMYAAVVPVETYVLRCTHLTIFMSLAFLLYPASKRKGEEPETGIPFTDKIFTAIVLVAGSYCVYFYPTEIADRLGDPTNLDMLMGVLIILGIIETTRRTVGIVFPILVCLSLAYSFWGNFLPVLSSRGYSLTRVIWHQMFTTEGVFGTTIGVTSSYVVLFVIFGVMMKNLGGSEFFMDLAKSLVGKFRGGPAKMAIIASASFGTISGSAVANVVGTGSFTIPLMKRSGYTPHFAGAVEASASIGGQIMPPVMGSVAFIMAEILQVSYARVCLAAFLPAIFYYTSLFLAVDSEAVKLNLKGIEVDRALTVKKLLLSHWVILLPLAVLVTLLLFMAWSPAQSVFYTILTMLASVVVDGLKKGKSISTIAREIYDAAVEGVFSSAMVVCLVAGAGIVVGTISLTGVGLKFSTMLLTLSGSNLLVLLVLTMIASTVLGMGMPSTALYIVVSTLLAPSIISLGVPALSAHLFVFYSGLMAGVTPPVAVPAYVAASIANANPYNTAITAYRISIPTLIVMYAFVYNPPFLFIGSPVEILDVFVSTLVSIYAIICGLQNCAPYHYRSFNPVMRLILIVLGVTGVLTVGALSVATTVVLVAGLFALPFLKNRMQGNTTPSERSNSNGA